MHIEVFFAIERKRNSDMVKTHTHLTNYKTKL